MCGSTALGFWRQWDQNDLLNFTPSVSRMTWLQCGMALTGTFHLSTMCVFYQVVTGDLGYPDQFPSIDSWLKVFQALPP